MRLFLWNVLLALVWALMTGQMTLANLLLGFGLGFAALFLAQAGPPAYFRKIPQLCGFLLWFLWQLLVSNYQVAYDVVTPRHHSRPGTLAIPLAAETPFEITLLANLITLTPGTLSLDVSDDRRTLYIHAMFIHDPEELRRDIKEGLERRLLELLR